jgi:hypothetical protein
MSLHSDAKPRPNKERQTYYSADVWLWRSIQQNTFALAEKRSCRIGDVFNLKAGMLDKVMY